MKNFWNLHRANFKLRSSLCLQLFATFSMLLWIQSCNPDPSSIGLEMQDDLLNATFTDTVTVTAYSVEEDSLNTKNLIYNYLGFIKDPVFGTTTTEIYTQFVPSKNTVNFGATPQLDSIVLTLKYSGGYYGDTLNSFAIEVYRLSEDMKSDTSTKYYQNSSVKYYPENLTYAPEFRLSPKPTTKVKADSLMEAHIRIRLNDELGRILLQNREKFDTDETFKEFFKGLYICAKPLTNDGCLVNFTLAHSITGIQLYYTRDNTPYRFSFPVAKDKLDKTVRFSTYEHNYGSGDPAFVNQVRHGDTLLGKTTLYVQAMGGVKTKITFPFLKAFENKNIVINKAELIITNISSESTVHKAPSKLGLQGINASDGRTVYLPDYTYFGATFFGGTAKDNEYRFRITKYLQHMISSSVKTYKPSLYLVTDMAAAAAHRMCLYGTDTNNPYRLRVEIYYTEY